MIPDMAPRSPLEELDDPPAGPSGPADESESGDALQRLRADIARIEREKTSPKPRSEPARAKSSEPRQPPKRRSSWPSRRGHSQVEAQQDTPPPSSEELRAQAYQHGMVLLVRREHSRKELGRKLGQRGLPREEVDEALEDLKRVDFQNDERFACALARSRAGAGQGPVRIRAELGTHGLPRETVDIAMESIEVDFRESAQGLLARRFSPQKLRDPAQRRKAVDFLLRRGFEQRLVYALVKAGPSEVDEDL